MSEVSAMKVHDEIAYGPIDGVVRCVHCRKEMVVDTIYFVRRFANPWVHADGTMTCPLAPDAKEHTIATPPSPLVAEAR